MKFAVLLYGQPRFIEVTKNRILKEYSLEGHSFDFFVHFWEQIGFCPQCDKNDNYITNPNLHNYVRDLNPKIYQITDYSDLDILISQLNSVLKFLTSSVVYKKSGNTALRDVYGQHLSLQKAFSLMALYEKKHNFKYDAVIKTRTDFIFKDEACYSRKEKYLEAKASSYILNLDKYGDTVVYATGLAKQTYHPNVNKFKNNNLGVYDPNDKAFVRDTFNYLRMSDIGLCCSRKAADFYYSKWFDTYISLFLENNNIHVYKRHDTIQGEIAILNNIVVKRLRKIRYHRLIFKDKAKKKWIRPDKVIFLDNKLDLQEQIHTQLVNFTV